MSLVVDTAYAVTAVAGVGLAGVAAHVHRDRDVLGSRALAGFFGLLGLGSLLIGTGELTGVVSSPSGIDFPGVVFSTAAVVGVTAPLALVFALQYTGRTRRPGRRLAAVIGGELFGVVVWFVAVWTRPDSVLRVVSNLWWALLSFVFTVVAVYTLATTVDGRVLDTTVAVGLLVPVVAVNTTWRFMVVVSTFLDRPAVAICVALVPVVSLLAAGFLFTRRDPFGTLPATRRIGRQAAIRETDDLVVVADDDDTVVETNAAANAVVDATVGTPTVAGLLGAPTDELASAETVALPDGRDYDPQVSRLSDHRDRSLGAVISLRDVTAREAREQRLSVLNRVLRHNVRNQMDVVRAHAEALDGDHAAAITETVDTVAKLGRDARTVDRLVSASEVGPVRLDEIVDDVVCEYCGATAGTEHADSVVVQSTDVADGDTGATATDEGDQTVVADGVGEVTVTTSVPAATVVTDERALEVALDSAVANAVEYANSRVEINCRPSADGESGGDGYVLSVADDGPGLPDSEQAALDIDRETQLEHATGLGLWKLRWAVDAFDGSVAVATDDGTTVSVTVPDLG